METKQLFARYGFKNSDVHGRYANCSSHASNLLRRTLMNLGITLDQLDMVSEEKWVIALNSASRQIENRGRECIVNPLVEELPLADIDIHMRGICRWMNELGIHTTMSCEGHGVRIPNVNTQTRPSQKQIGLLRHIAPSGMTIRVLKTSILFDCDHRMELLLQLAEKLYEIADNPDFCYEAEQFKPLLIRLLSIPGVSGNERLIQQRMFTQLRLLQVDALFKDRIGNVCATVYCGEGPTVLLCAHMDVYLEIEPCREIIQNGTTLYSSKGILGADDRAGLAVIIEMVSNIHNTNFKGTLKIAFTVKEEIGLIGAERLDSSFLADVDAAIVVDRRGTRDIVTSWAGSTPFCSEQYGLLFEEAGRLAGMDNWKVTAGGSSDALVLSQQFGIPSVNLSVGYRHEHTDQESVDYLSTYQTYMLIECVMHHQLIAVRDKS